MIALLLSLQITAAPGDDLHHARKSAKQVVLKGGLHVLREPLVFGPEDSGAAWSAAPGETPVISAGRPLSGWAVEPDGTWSLPQAGASFRQLFVDGRRAVRARTPNAGEFFRVDGEVSLEKQSRLKCKDLRPEWVGAELVVLQSWAEARLPIRAVAGGVATLGTSVPKYNREKNARFWVEDAPGALDAPGEWQLRDGVLRYKPLPGQDPATVQAVAANLPLILKIDGAKGVTFKGITFAHADWTLPEDGYPDVQAAFDIPGAIRAERAVECVFEACRIVSVGGYGLELGRGCRRNKVLRCEVVDCGAGGIKIGEPALRKEEVDQAHSNEVLDSHVHDLGHVYPAGVGIWVGHSARNRLAHNHVHDTCYSGFSIGWSWGYGPSGAQENVIEHNYVHHIGRGMLADMGGIYTLGTCTGTVIRHNVFHDVWSSTYGGWGIYFDEGTTGVVAENNIAYRCKSNGFHQHYGKDNVLRNNVFALNAESQIARTRAEPHPTLTVERNLVYWTTGSLLSGDWGNGTFRFEKNLYWNPTKPGAGTPADWAAKGWDKASVVADPLFVDPEKGDFRLKPGSPALKLGFVPIDVSKVGPRP